MLKVVAALTLVTVFAISSHIAAAGADIYYECTRPDGAIEYSLYPCEAGQEQRYIVGNQEARAEESKTAASKKPRRAMPSSRQVRQQRGGESPSGNAGNLASYKCVGKSGDILYTDASDYLAFEVYRCTRVTLDMACDEAQRLKAADPLAVVSSKLQCPER